MNTYYGPGKRYVRFTTKGPGDIWGSPEDDRGPVCPECGEEGRETNGLTSWGSRNDCECSECGHEWNSETEAMETALARAGL